MVLDRTRNALTRDLVKYLFPIQPCVRREVPVDPKEEDIAARLSGDVEVDPNLESHLVGGSGSGNFDMMDAMAGLDTNLFFFCFLFVKTH